MDPALDAKVFLHRVHVPEFGEGPPAIAAEAVHPPAPSRSLNHHPSCPWASSPRYPLTSTTRCRRSSSPASVVEQHDEVGEVTSGYASRRGRAHLEAEVVVLHPGPRPADAPRPPGTAPPPKATVENGPVDVAAAGVGLVSARPGGPEVDARRRAARVVGVENDLHRILRVLPPELRARDAGGDPLAGPVGDRLVRKLRKRTSRPCRRDGCPATRGRMRFSCPNRCSRGSPFASRNLSSSQVRGELVDDLARSARRRCARGRDPRSRR